MLGSISLYQETSLNHNNNKNCLKFRTEIAYITPQNSEYHNVQFPQDRTEIQATEKLFVSTLFLRPTAGHKPNIRIAFTEYTF